MTQVIWTNLPDFHYCVGTCRLHLIDISLKLQSHHTPTLHFLFTSTEDWPTDEFMQACPALLQPSLANLQGSPLFNQNKPRCTVFGIIPACLNTKAHHPATRLHTAASLSYTVYSDCDRTSHPSTLWNWSHHYDGAGCYRLAQIIMVMLAVVVWATHCDWYCGLF